MQNFKFKNIFLIYLSFLYLTAIYYLYLKHTGGLDSTISEWLINYFGGFTRRGLAGEIFANISINFDTEVRFVIFIFQSLFYLIFLILIYFYFKNLKNYFLFYVCLFCPLLLTYHVAELEILARKEILVFINFLIFLLIAENKNLRKYVTIYLFVTLPIILLIWEPVVFFFPFYILILFNIFYKNNLKEIIIKIILTSIPSLFIIILLITNEYNVENEKLMCESLKKVLNESCYMSLSYLDTSIADNFNSLFKDIKAVHIIRYFLIYLIGFSPLFYLLYFMKKNTISKNYLLNNYKIIHLYFFSSSLIIILFLMGLDWGRWINIYYFFSYCSIYFLIKNKYYTINENYLKIFNNLVSFNKRYLLIIFFIIFCFGWNPKTLFKGDVASLPGYRVPYNLIKSILNQL